MAETDVEMDEEIITRTTGKVGRYMDRVIVTRGLKHTSSSMPAGQDEFNSVGVSLRVKNEDGTWNDDYGARFGNIVDSRARTGQAQQRAGTVMVDEILHAQIRNNTKTQALGINGMTVLDAVFKVVKDLGIELT